MLPFAGRYRPNATATRTKLENPRMTRRRNAAVKLFPPNIRPLRSTIKSIDADEIGGPMLIG